MTAKLCFSHFSRQLSDALAEDGYQIDYKLIIEFCQFEIAAHGASKLTESDGVDLYSPPAVLFAIYGEWMAAVGKELGFEVNEGDEAAQWVTPQMTNTRALLKSVAELGVASMAKLDTAMRAESGFGMNEVLAKAAESSESLEQTTTRLQRQHKGLKAIRGDKDRFR